MTFGLDFDADAYRRHGIDSHVMTFVITLDQEKTIGKPGGMYGVRILPCHHITISICYVVITVAQAVQLPHGLALAEAGR